MEVMPDYVHLLVDCSPQFVIPRMIKIESDRQSDVFQGQPQMVYQSSVALGSM
ncbi:MAG: hypothetical protein J5846_01000 [Desulfovibrio sp.]|nr:hypothetical protein [Desulfovibrio sp.]